MECISHCAIEARTCVRLQVWNLSPFWVYDNLQNVSLTGQAVVNQIHGRLHRRMCACFSQAICQFFSAICKETALLKLFFFYLPFWVYSCWTRIPTILTLKSHFSYRAARQMDGWYKGKREHIFWLISGAFQAVQTLPAYLMQYVWTMYPDHFLLSQSGVVLSMDWNNMWLERFLRPQPSMLPALEIYTIISFLQTVHNAAWEAGTRDYMEKWLGHGDTVGFITTILYNRLEDCRQKQVRW